MAKEQQTTAMTPQVTPQPSGEMGKFIIYKYVKKTNLNPEGKKLMMVTFAPSIEAASELARDMIDKEDGPRFEVVPVK